MKINNIKKGIAPLSFLAMLGMTGCNKNAYSMKRSISAQESNASTSQEPSISRAISQQMPPELLEGCITSRLEEMARQYKAGTHLIIREYGRQDGEKWVLGKAQETIKRSFGIVAKRVEKYADIYGPIKCLEEIKELLEKGYPKKLEVLTRKMIKATLNGAEPEHKSKFKYVAQAIITEAFENFVKDINFDKLLYELKSGNESKITELSSSLLKKQEYKNQEIKANEHLAPKNFRGNPRVSEEDRHKLSLLKFEESALKAINKCVSDFMKRKSSDQESNASTSQGPSTSRASTQQRSPSRGLEDMETQSILNTGESTDRSSLRKGIEKIKQEPRGNESGEDENNQMPYLQPELSLEAMNRHSVKLENVEMGGPEERRRKRVQLRYNQYQKDLQESNVIIKEFQNHWNVNRKLDFDIRKRLLKACDDKIEALNKLKEQIDQGAKGSTSVSFIAKELLIVKDDKRNAEKEIPTYTLDGNA